VKAPAVFPACIILYHLSATASLCLEIPVQKQLINANRAIAANGTDIGVLAL
jgi:hypothetical protein